VKIDGFDWDEDNVFKNILTHDTFPDEIEEAFYKSYKLRKTKQLRYLLYGKTESGRYLFIVFIVKVKDRKRLIRVISARDMTSQEKNYYLKK